MDKIVVYCGTRNHYPVMETAVKSLLYNTPVDKVYFFIEDDTFPSYIPDVITTVNVSDQHYFDQNGANAKSYWTYMAFVRLAMAKILPDCHQALYLDTDTIILQNITDLFNTNLSGNVFAMVTEDVGDITLELCNGFSMMGNQIKHFKSDSPRPQYPIRPYYNSGVMLMNLDELRTTGMDDRIIHEINTVNYEYPDQDAINLLCHDRIIPLPPEYNVIASLRPDFPYDQIKIKHFASEKPLWKSSLWQSYRRMNWNTVTERQNSMKGMS